MDYQGYELDFFDKPTATEVLWQQVADLMMGALNWPVSRERIVIAALLDPRFSADPIGIYAVDKDGTMVGFVGMGRRTMVVHEREIPTGHIWSMAVRSDHTRKGIGMALLRLAIESFKEEDRENITLYSSTALVAYNMYRTMGFKDHHRLVYRLADHRKKMSRMPLRELTREELSQICELYDRHLGGLEGFSRREGDVFRLMELWSGTSRKSYMTIDPPGTLEGYVIMDPEPLRGLTVLTEIVGPDEEWYVDALEAVRTQKIGDRVFAGHRNPAAFEAFELQRFNWHDIKPHEMMMAIGPDIVEEDEGWMTDPGWFLESRFDVF
jgi:ribosomal protein S18 acetylase RimI-like enzyme